jgi:hypothetical protein
VATSPSALYRENSASHLRLGHCRVVWRPSRIIDDLAVRVDVPTSLDIRNAADFLNSRHTSIAPCRWAVIVHAQLPAVFGMLRMANGLIEGSPISLRAFTSVGQALIWLGPQPVTGSPT